MCQYAGECMFVYYCLLCQAEDGIRDLVRSRGLGDVYKRQRQGREPLCPVRNPAADGYLHLDRL
mgnify:CR=1 FL=1